MDKKLIIWDFDGVIADTESVWLKNRMNFLNEKFKLKYDMPTMNKLFGGTNDKYKRKLLNDMGVFTDDKFWDDILATEIEYMKNNYFELTKNIEEIFKLNNFTQCIATSGTKFKTDMKIESCGLSKYFSEDKIFTSDNVAIAKPEPDLFLYTAKHMGYKPSECIVIEDSLNGMTAGLRANMKTIAFIGHCLSEKELYIKQIRELGITDIFDNMSDLKEFLLNNS